MTQLKSLVMQSRVNPADVSPRPKLNLISVASFEENFQPSNIENVDDDEAKRHGALKIQKKCNALIHGIEGRAPHLQLKLTQVHL